MNIRRLIHLIWISWLLTSPLCHAKPMAIPNSLVVDQNGQSLHFYDDLIKNNTVAINFIFTRCGFTCPLLGFKFGVLQQQLAKTPDPNTLLISVSTDPLNDTPARLKTWMEQYGHGDNWRLITGDKSTIDGLLKALQSFAADISDHSTVILIGNDQAQQWTRMDGQSSVAQLQHTLLELQQAASHHE